MERWFEVYAEARSINSEKQKRSLLLQWGGAALQDIFFTFKGDDLSKYDEALGALTNYFQPLMNVPYYLFRYL